eukprot:5129666-Pleurochrysis_carterae.AAC.1
MAIHVLQGQSLQLSSEGCDTSSMMFESDFNASVLPRTGTRNFCRCESHNCSDSLHTIMWRFALMHRA